MKHKMMVNKNKKLIIAQTTVTKIFIVYRSLWNITFIFEISIMIYKMLWHSKSLYNEKLSLDNFVRWRNMTSSNFILYIAHFDTFLRFNSRRIILFSAKKIIIPKYNNFCSKITYKFLLQLLKSQGKFIVK